MSPSNSARINSETVPSVADQIATLLETATAAANRGDFQAAGLTLRSACAQMPLVHDLWLQCADLLHRSSDLESTEACLREAISFHPRSRELNHSLGLILMQAGRSAEAKEYLENALSLAPENVDVLNDYAVLLDHLGEFDAALDRYATGLTLADVSRKLVANYIDLARRLRSRVDFDRATAVYRSKWGADSESFEWETVAGAVTPIATTPRRAKIAFFASSKTFIDSTIRELQKHHEVRVVERLDNSLMQSTLQWCDLAWIEWCDQFVIAASKLPKTCKIICRLHSYEVFTDLPRQVDWSKIDHLVLVNESVKELLAYNTQISTPTSVIYNGVDIDKFTIPANKVRSKSICSIGYINYKKNPALLLYCFKAIHEWDPEFTFHIAGEHQDARIQVYWAHLLPKLGIPLQFDGWTHDVPEYLRDKDYVISTSLFESFHYSIAEGMASGALPLIHDWFGADKLYPREFLFTTPADCLRLLRELETQDRCRLQQSCRRHIVSRFDQKKQQRLTENLIDQVLWGKSGEA